MLIFGIVTGSYLLAGAIFLTVFQLRTHRIGKRMQDVSLEVQTRIAVAGSVAVPPKAAIIITLLYAWIFWVAVLIGYISDSRKYRPEKK